jgi:arylsulfatase A-like enzyme
VTRRAPYLATSLVGVLVVARVLATAHRDLPLTWWSPAALLWHDCAVGFAFWLLDRSLRRPRWMWAPYWVIAAYVALNVPAAWALSSPLTVPMWRAAGGPLADSIRHYVAPASLTAMAVVLACAFVFPRIARWLGSAVRFGLTLVALATVAAGPLIASRVDTRGLQRNAITAILGTMTPRIAARTEHADWRASPVAEGSRDDLSALAGAAAGRNVILIVLESMAAQYLKFHGAGDDPTPNLTAVAEQSVVFDAAYAAYPESIKGLFALLCSRAPAFDTTAEAHAASACAPLPRSLKSAGYRTALFHSGRFAYLGMQAVVDGQGFDTAEDAGAIGGTVQSSFGVDEPATVARMVAWLDRLDRSQRFFITYLPAAGHHPYATASPGPFQGTSELIAYKNALFDGDRALGTFLQALEARGLTRQTLFVFLGDHGEAFGQHDGNLGHSLFLYEENLRVPLVISVPGSPAARGRVGRVASVLDVTPTVLDLLGLPLSPLHEGGSLLSPRGRMALFHTDYAVGWLGLRDTCWKAIVEVESTRTQLFDVCSDPAEKTDRSGERPDLADAYRDRLERWAAATKARYK